MRHFFLDTNVVFDYLGRREPNGVAAVALFQAAYDGRVTLHVSSLSFSHVFYTLRKQLGAGPAREMLRKLARLVQITAVDAAVVEAALESDFADVEDAMQHFAALALPEVEAIVTGDPKGFKESQLLVLTDGSLAVGEVACNFKTFPLSPSRPAAARA